MALISSPNGLQPALSPDRRRSEPSGRRMAGEDGTGHADREGAGWVTQTKRRDAVVMCSEMGVIGVGN